MSFVWIDGRLVDAADAGISPFDQALLTGDGVFETMRVRRGTPFALTRHLGRLARSAAGLRLPCPAGTVVAAAVHAVVEANGLVDGRVRVTVTGGRAPLGADRATIEPTVIVTGGPLPGWPATADVVVSPWARNERGALVGIKTVSYGENVVALADAVDRGAGEAIFANLAGNLCEGASTNVFVGIGGRLVTPPISAGCLAGVTRELVLELVDAVEDDLPITALASADEAFLTSSTRDVHPVHAVDGRPLARCPGPLTAAAAAAFRDLVAADVDP